MFHALVWLLIAFAPASIIATSPFEETAKLPVATNGRFAPLDAAARQWLYDLYHRKSLEFSDLTSFNASDASALSLIWNTHFLGSAELNHAPLIWVHYASVKELLHLNPLEDRFSIHALDEAFRKHSKSIENSDLDLKVKDEIFQLFGKLKSIKEWSQTQAKTDPYVLFEKHLRENPNITESQISESLLQFPLEKRLKQASTLKMLPLKHQPGDWVSLHALNLQIYDPISNKLQLIDNFTAFANEDFYPLRESYLTLQDAVLNKKSLAEIKAASAKFSKLYFQAYEAIIGEPYKKADGKALTYPTTVMLGLESWMEHFPLIECAIAAYLISFLFLFLNVKTTKQIAFIFLCTGLILHTIALILRCYILKRPPVSNMFETVIYVPWIGMIIGFIYYAVSRSRVALASALAASIALLIVLKLTQMNMKFENVQAVLDSQYWLIIHVLMVVGSYGAFLVCGVIAHAYLVNQVFRPSSLHAKAKMSQAVLTTMYIGVALLIPGTILGGVWALESWGRFWDWDPKESWAFITACVYLLIIHAHTFKHIGDVGLSVGAIGGMMAVSFTWYGVNYILGTGLHTYGFGKGGEFYYFLYLGMECLFLAGVLSYLNRRKILNKREQESSQRIY